MKHIALIISVIILASCSKEKMEQRRISKDIDKYLFDNKWGWDTGSGNITYFYEFNKTNNTLTETNNSYQTPIIKNYTFERNKDTFDLNQISGNGKYRIVIDEIDDNHYICSYFYYKSTQKSEIFINTNTLKYVKIE